MGLYILDIGLNMLQVDVLLYQTAVESSKVLRRRCAVTASKKRLSSPFAPLGSAVAVDEAARGCGPDHAAASLAAFFEEASDAKNNRRT